MSVGQSGRIVIEIDPEFKRELYDALGNEGLSLKQWFVEKAEVYLKNRSQLPLQLIVDDTRKAGSR